MPSQPVRSIVALALAELPDGRWSVNVSYDDDTADLTTHTNVRAARARVVGILAAVPVKA